MLSVREGRGERALSLGNFAVDAEVSLDVTNKAGSDSLMNARRDRPRA